ncbi:hypothetical protein HMPREF3187_00591 [Aerococcus christensenii]|uniref:Uncharacterized protein n=1 Tax=Aerococcus christensenii TaxID=87541 RepID=A0A133Y2E6_9LACT|nr:hypothetical protein HMPREF3187_00591 [Aerococcus christensenii]
MQNLQKLFKLYSLWPLIASAHLFLEHMFLFLTIKHLFGIINLTGRTSVLKS